MSLHRTEDLAFVCVEGEAGSRLETDRLGLVWTPRATRLWASDRMDHGSLGKVGDQGKTVSSAGPVGEIGMQEPPREWLPGA